ncbi:hypothetical protein OPV22_018267 [Ensete ventricosum]|uniref:Uncharacterized protein n=1 Tax=Ensete ventricosum TaxID=4639 RepID=A0AAV8QZY4_ENSVE|nr:hypothetical protein OPV22_018267 [Ensete ventricosum]
MARVRAKSPSVQTRPAPLPLVSSRGSPPCFLPPHPHPLQLLHRRRRYSFSLILVHPPEVRHLDANQSKMVQV